MKTLFALAFALLSCTSSQSNPRIDGTFTGNWTSDCTANSGSYLHNQIEVASKTLLVKKYRYSDSACTLNKNLVSQYTLEYTQTGDQMRWYNPAPTEGQNVETLFQVLELSATDCRLKLTGGSYLKGGVTTPFTAETIAASEITHFSR